MSIKQFEPLWGVWRTEDKPIGQGSFGKVYRAWREEFGKKYYAAIKHISIPVSEAQISDAVSEGVADTNESLRDYFAAITQNLVSEITLMNEVKGHTNIVSYEDHLIIPKESGIGYDIIIRMELLTGLNDVLRHRQMTNKDVIKLGIDICSALEICLEKGIVHRDIKPSNIFVNDIGDYKLGDFGVARELDHTTAGMSKKGTYIYMAPEIYRGEPANFSADTFSLGIVMYRLLNGNRAPFLPVGTSKIDPEDNDNALARRMSGEPLPAPAFADRELAEVILKATQFDKYQRFANPTEFKQALMCVRDGIPVTRAIPVVAAPTNNTPSPVVPPQRGQQMRGAPSVGVPQMPPVAGNPMVMNMPPVGNMPDGAQTASFVPPMPVGAAPVYAAPNEGKKKSGWMWFAVAAAAVLVVAAGVLGTILLTSGGSKPGTNGGSSVETGNNDHYEDDYPGEYLPPLENQDQTPDYAEKIDKSCICAVSFSGCIDDNGDRTYGGGNTIDGDPDTCWIVNSEVPGASGEWIEYYLIEERCVSGLRMINGNVYQDDYYFRNGHIKEFRLDFSDGTTLYFTAKEIESRSMYENEFTFDEPVNTTWIRLTIESSYIGTKESYVNNSAMAEIEFY